MYWPGIPRSSRNGSPFLEYGWPGEGDFTAVNKGFTSQARSSPSTGTFGSSITIENKDSDGHLKAFPSTVQKLANLDVALYECGLKLPYSTKPDGTSTEHEIDSSREAKLFAIDEIFRLTADFIESVRNLSGAESHERAHLPSIDPRQLVFQPSQKVVMNGQQTCDINNLNPAGMGLKRNPFSQVDEATMFMIMSCHSRLIEIYTSVFQMMQACIEHSLAPQMGKGWGVILPRLQIGSVASLPVHVDIDTPVSSAISSMYMLMITMISSQLWGQLASATRVGDGVNIDSATMSSSGFSDTILYTLTDKNERIMRVIDATSHLLQPSSTVSG